MSLRGRKEGEAYSDEAVIERNKIISHFCSKELRFFNELVMLLFITGFSYPV